MFGTKRVDLTTLKVGDLLIHHVRNGSWSSAEHWGRVTKITPKGTITITYAGTETQIRASSHSDLRVPSDYELAMRVWHQRRPDVTVIKIGRTGFGRGETSEFRVELNINTEDIEFVGDHIETAVRELTAFQSWYAKKPKES